MFDRKPSYTQTQSALQFFRDRGVSTIVAQFSGGNDEGGIDSIDYLDADGKKINTIPSSSAYEDRYWQGGREHNRGWIVYDRSLGDTWADQKRAATPDEVALAEALKVIEHPVYDRYYTFAGEFYVDGTLTWDVTAGTHEMHGQESHEVYEDF